MGLTHGKEVLSPASPVTTRTPPPTGQARWGAARLPITDYLSSPAFSFLLLSFQVCRPGRCSSAVTAAFKFHPPRSPLPSRPGSFLLLKFQVSSFIPFSATAPPHPPPNSLQSNSLLMALAARQAVPPFGSRIRVIYRSGFVLACHRKARPLGSSADCR